ncbi:hypothetical protein [Synechococcus sp. LTW-R]|uniref:hypothetical protein n=1 Tax=Synechococcus sp. LTW-R TaxID=2751170 RepID=UPI00162803CF|nr:hypothetical protein [Synechococcus sp. LTW-R]QNG28927.1 hypothetical protein H0O22_09250 [Synechococcus sp. LTW-R]
MKVGPVDDFILCAMSNYYPLPTEYTFHSGNSQIKIETNLGFTNIVTNRLSTNLLNPLRKGRGEIDLWLHVFALMGQEWRLIEIRKCEGGESTSFARSLYPEYRSNTIVIVPLSERIVEASLKELPEPTALKVDRVPIAPRSTYSFFLGEVVSSYQGEYPASMSRIKGSMLSFDYLSCSTNEHQKAYLLLMNLKRSAESQAMHKINIIDSKSRKPVGSFNALENHFTWHEITKKDELLVNAYTCTTCAFIPIYINCSRSSAGPEINVEHTHPPSEHFWMGDDMKLTSELKSKWLQIN